MRRLGKRVAVIGAGPSGLEAALLTRKIGLNVTIYEKGRVGEHIERWGFVRMFTPFGWNSTSLGRNTVKSQNPKHILPNNDSHLTGREFVGEYLMPLAATEPIAENLVLETQVVSIGRENSLKQDMRSDRTGPFRLLLRDSKGQESIAHADVVLDCTGTYGQPRFMGCGGIPAIGELGCRNSIASGMEDVAGGQKSKYAGKTVMVVGAGATAATHVCALADLAAQNNDTWIIWLARSARSQPLHRLANDPLKERDALVVRANNLATRGEGNVEFHGSATVERVVHLGPDKGFQVAARIGDAIKSWDVDRIVSSVGYRPDRELYRELHVRECPNTEAPEISEPDYFVLGAKSQGRNSMFFLRDGLDHIRQTLSKLTDKPLPNS